MMLPRRFRAKNSSLAVGAETQHFLRCVGPLRIRIGAGRAASGPRVAGTVDIPVLQKISRSPLTWIVWV